MQYDNDTSNENNRGFKMQKLIELKNWKTGEVIYSYESEYNHIKFTLEKAVKENIDLSYVDLQGFNLRGCDLRNVKLSYAKLNNSNLRYVNLGNGCLKESDLSHVDLRNINLNNTDLSNVNLNNTDFRYTKGDNEEIKNIECGTINVVFTKDVLAIGCQQHSIEKWKNFTDAEIAKMDDNALRWCRKWKDFILKTIEENLK